MNSAMSESIFLFLCFVLVESFEKGIEILLPELMVRLLEQGVVLLLLLVHLLVKFVDLLLGQ